MALTKAQKTDVIAKMWDMLKAAHTVVFVNFHGLGVSDTNALRRSLRDQEVGYSVIKKSLLKRALTDAKLEGKQPALDGEVAVAYGEDPVAPASGIASFMKQHKDNLSIIGGVFDGRFMDKVEMEAIATIPSLHTLKGMFVNVINSPIQGLAVALSEIAKKKA
jgi:large subunit ribosomal protein L10